MSDFRFKMEGPVFNEGIPLPVALSSLQEVQAIFDKTYLVLNGGHKITKKDRDSFYLKTFNIKHGSLESDLQIIYEVAQYTLPAIAAYTPKDVWDLTQQGWNFLKFIYGLAAKGEKPMYEAKDNATINVFHGDNVRVYDAPVVKIGELSVNHWRALNHKLKEGHINNYSMGNPEDPEIELSSEFKNIFDTPTHIDKTPVEVPCDIFDFNKRSNAGKLTVTGGTEIPEGDYSFTVVGDQDRIEYISSMAKPEIKALVLKEMSIDPLGETKIKRLHIIEVHP
jgi:hypothetical protein